jgi:hypothetical protein
VKETSPQAGPALDMPLYERLIDDGIAEADQRGGAVDHLTARRIAIWLNARPQQLPFAQALAQFTRTGDFSRQLLAELRARARSVNSPNQVEASRLLQYHASRGPDLGPIGTDFGANCDRIDQADAMLIDARDRSRLGIGRSEQAGHSISARADWDSVNQTVAFSMDEATAGIAINAIAAYAAEREAYARDVMQFGQGLPEGSYGRRNREAMATRDARAAARLRAVERAYRIAIGHVAAPAPDPAIIRDDPDQVADRQMELE